MGTKKVSGCQIYVRNFVVAEVFKNREYLVMSIKKKNNGGPTRVWTKHLLRDE